MVQYDIDEVEKKTRAYYAEVLATGEEDVAKGEFAPEQLQVMKHFTEVLVQFRLAGCRAMNEGIEPHLISGVAGEVCGRLYGEAIVSAGPYAEITMQACQSAMEGILTEAEATPDDELFFAVVQVQ